MITLGPILARGRTSDVYSLGSDSAVKVPRPDVPRHWAGIEAEIATAVHRAGLPTPEVRDLITVDGRESVVFERVDGPSLWEALLAAPASLPELVSLMVDMQREIHGVEAPPGIRPLEARVCSKIRGAGLLTEPERTAALELVSSLPSGSALCHGDLHPGNILIGRSGPVVIDWFDAAAGDRAADLVRTSLLIRSPVGGLLPGHLPGASTPVLQALHRSYLVTVLADGPPSAGELLQWEQVLAAGRLSENTGADHCDLLSLLREGDGSWPPTTQLACTLADLGML